MKTTANRIIFFVILLSLAFLSCSKDDSTNEPEEPKYSVVQTLSSDAIILNLSAFGQAALAEKVKYGVNVYKYEYSLIYKGESITASGLLATPNTAGEYPMLSFQHGTLVAKSEAVSSNLLSSSLYTSIAGFGYVVLIPDLIGFGSSEEYFHPYLVKEPNVEAISQMIISVRDIPDTDLNGILVNDSLFLLGYSQGGWLTLAQHEFMEQQDDLEMHLIASSCGAGPYNPEMIMKYTMEQETYEKPFYLAYVFLSFVENGDISNDLNMYFQEPYASAIPDLFDGMNSGNKIDAELTQNMSEYYQADFITNYTSNSYNELKTALNENRVNAWKNGAPILFTHGASDTYIPSFGTDSMVAEFNNSGSQLVQLNIYNSLDHNTAAIPSVADALLWFENFRNPNKFFAVK